MLTMNEEGVNTTSSPSVSSEDEVNTNSVSRLRGDAIEEDAR